jgi:hypothetical protein
VSPTPSPTSAASLESIRKAAIANNTYYVWSLFKSRTKRRIAIPRTSQLADSECNDGVE